MEARNYNVQVNMISDNDKSESRRKTLKKKRRRKKIHYDVNESTYSVRIPNYSDDSRYASVVSKKSVLVSFLLLALMGILIVLNIVFELVSQRNLIVAFGGGVGFIFLLRRFTLVEVIFFLAILYLPFSSVVFFKLAAGINTTSILLIVLLVSTFIESKKNNQKYMNFLPGSYQVLGLGFLGALSLVTLMLHGDQVAYAFPSGLVNDYAAWIYQFAFYLITISVVKTTENIKYIIAMMIVATTMVVIFGVLEYRNYAQEFGFYFTHTQARLEGPHQQPNQFAAILAYSVLPIIALWIVCGLRSISWVLMLGIVLALGVTLFTFSRGAYLALVVSLTVMVYLRGFRYFVLTLLILACAVAISPTFIFDPVLERVDSTVVEENSPDIATGALDTSSEARLELWSAGGAMTLHNPLFGVGFEGYAIFLDEYVRGHITLTDPHNMFLYVSSQMGIPALVLFVLILVNMIVMGRRLTAIHHSRFVRAIGLGGVGVGVCTFMLNIFGSRFLDLNVTCLFLIYYAVLQKLVASHVQRAG